MDGGLHITKDGNLPDGVGAAREHYENPFRKRIMETDVLENINIKSTRSGRWVGSLHRRAMLRQRKR